MKLAVLLSAVSYLFLTGASLAHWSDEGEILGFWFSDEYKSGEGKRVCDLAKIDKEEGGISRILEKPRKYSGLIYFSATDVVHVKSHGRLISLETRDNVF